MSVEKRLDEIKDELKMQRGTLSSMQKTLTENTVIVKEHERRSTLLEKEVQHLESRVVPVEDHVKFIDKSGKVIAFLALCGGLALTVLRLFG